MRMKAVLTVNEGPEALRQVAAIVGFAHSMSIPLTLTPEEDPKSEHLRWGREDVRVHESDSAAWHKAQRVLPRGAVMHRREFVRDLGKALKKPTKSIGSMVSRWIRDGVMEEVRP